MERFADAVETFDHAIARARQMVALFDALQALRPTESANDDALRSAYFLAVSSFDFLVHELAAVEAKHRFTNGARTKNIHLPMEVMTVVDDHARLSEAESHIRQANSYRAFVDPGKLSEILGCYCAEPWAKIAALVNAGILEGERKSMDDLKGRLKSIWKRRNQIAHEADVNPTLAGVTLWPIDKVDAELTINFIVLIGKQLPHVISEPLPVAA